MRDGNSTTNKKKAQDIVVCADWKLQKKKVNSTLTGGPSHRHHLPTAGFYRPRSVMPGLENELKGKRSDAWIWRGGDITKIAG